jgi:hypothetical protein
MERKKTMEILKRFPPEERAARLAIRFVELTIQYSTSGHVATPVDAAQLSIGHPIRWIQRKKNCKD